MKRVAEGLKQVLVGYLPAGCLEWAAECRPDAARLFADAFAEMDAAVAAGNGAAFRAAIQQCAVMCQRVISVYTKEQATARPLTTSALSLDPWSGISAPVRRGASHPRGRNDRAALVVSGSATPRAPRPPQGEDPANGPDGAAA